MARKRSSGTRRSAEKRGTSPGSAIYVGEARSHEVALTVLDYTPEGVGSDGGVEAEQLQRMASSDSISWVNLDGVYDVARVQEICGAFGVHVLVVEDILNTGSRPKVEDFGETIFVVARMLSPAEGGDHDLVEEQVSIVLGASWVLTFQERSGDLFDPIRKRIRSGTGRIRRMGSDYLLHAVLDAIVDGYFAALDGLEERICAVEERALLGGGSDLPHTIHALKSELLSLRRHIWPLREATDELIRAEGSLVRPETVPFFRDLRDHVVQILEQVDSSRDRLTAALELHLAVTSNRMNEVMGVLTIVASVFIPLTFIAGIYGMNFDHMPELSWRLGYPAVWVLMGTIATGMLAWFRHKRWI